MARRIGFYGVLAGLALAVLGVLVGASFIVIFPGCLASAWGFCYLPNILQGLEQAISGGLLIIGGILVALVFGRAR